jgi:ABC-2 type transport system ATP-binding protein
MSIALEAVGVGKTFGAVKALDALSLRIPKGGVYGILGPNGAGKSTLFRIVLGLVRPTAGEARLLGAAAGDIKALRRIGAVIETPRFLPWLTARDTLKVLALESGEGKPDIDGWLDRVGLTEAADRTVHGFSVGMKQRLALAAALLSRPEVVILDEPTSGMDPAGILGDPGPDPRAGGPGRRHRHPGQPPAGRGPARLRPRRLPRQGQARARGLGQRADGRP